LLDQKSAGQELVFPDPNKVEHLGAQPVAKSKQKQILDSLLFSWRATVPGQVSSWSLVLNVAFSFSCNF
jgi:hypothetical protein